MAKLYFRYGAMNCGKTTLLLQTAYNYEERGMHIQSPLGSHSYIFLQEGIPEGHSQYYKPLLSQ